MKKIILFSLILLSACKSCPKTVMIAPIQRLQIPPEPICQSEYAIDLAECVALRGEYIKLLQNNINEFLRLYNNIAE